MIKLDWTFTHITKEQARDRLIPFPSYQIKGMADFYREYLLGMTKDREHMLQVIELLEEVAKARKVAELI